MTGIKNYFVQWTDGAGTHRAHTRDDLNAAITLAMSLEQAIDPIGNEPISIYNEEDGCTTLVQRF